MNHRSFSTLAFTVALGASAAAAQPRPRLGTPVQRATALCRQGDEEQHADHLAEARAHLQEGLALVESNDTPTGRRARLACASTLAGVLATQNDRAGAWAQMQNAWRAASALPASAWAGQEPWMFELAQRVWAGPRCAEGVDPSGLEEAEVAALQSLARFNTPAVAECLGAIRQRERQERRGACLALDALPQGVAPYAPGAAGWTRVDDQTAVGGDGESVYVARGAGNAARYVRCYTGHSEAQLAGQWALPGAALAVTARIRPCGEDMDARRCPPETLAWVLDGQGQLLGHYALQRSSLSDRGPLAQPFGPVAAPVAFRAEGANLRAGTRLLRVSQGALVNAQ